MVYPRKRTLEGNDLFFSNNCVKMSIIEAIKDKNDIRKIEYILRNNNRNLMLFLLGINSGLRISDILNLNVADVKNKKFITITEQKQKIQKISN